MSRRTSAERRPVVPDFKYGEKTITQFISCLMKDGKRSTAQRLFYDAVGQAEKKSGESGLEVFRKALNNVKPVLEVRSRRVGGATYQVPIEIRDVRREALAMRWVIAAARSRSGRSMAERLAAELGDAFNNTGTAVKKKEDTHRMAEANKAFAHYRW